MVFPAPYNLSGPKQEDIICSGSKEPLYSLGVTDLKTPGGNIVRGYCAERSLCDVLRTRNHTDVQVVTDALLRDAFRATTEKRGSGEVVKHYREIMQVVRNSSVMNRQWNDYRKDFDK